VSGAALAPGPEVTFFELVLTGKELAFMLVIRRKIVIRNFPPQLLHSHTTSSRNTHLSQVEQSAESEEELPDSSGLEYPSNKGGMSPVAGPSS